MPLATLKAPKAKNKKISPLGTAFHTVGTYLLEQLKLNGVEHIFGLPGDYVLRFDKLIEQQPGIKFINTTRENTAGYMADAYARMKGLGVACITYGVGVNISNALSQAYVENVPLVVISGAAATDEFIPSHHQLHHLIHKTSNGRSSRTQLEIFKNVTIAQTVLENAATAPAEIDRVLAACLEHKKPVYIELPRNIVDAQILPEHLHAHKAPKSDPKALEEALYEVSNILKNCLRPVLWIGHEIQRFRLADAVMNFAERYRIPIVSSLLGKTAISERHPLFVGVYQGKMSRPEVRDFVDSCDCAIQLGVLLSDVDTGIFTAKLDHEARIVASADTLYIKNHQYPHVWFPEFVHKLEKLNLNVRFREDYPANIDRKQLPFVPSSHKKINVARTFECLQSHLRAEHIVVADIGDCLFGSTDLILEQDSYLSCAHFGSLGYGTPGAIGAQIAAPKRRVIGLVGDGAFQMTSMELSTAVRYHLDPIIIVLNNHGYGTERPLLDGKYNDIVDWNYTEIPRVLGGGKGIKVTTEEEFEKALTNALAHRGQFYLIEVELEKTDFSPTMQRFFSVQTDRKKK